MIQPNFDIMLWVILIFWVLSSFAEIVMGLLRMEIPKNYGGVHIISGFIRLGVIAYVLFK